MGLASFDRLFNGVLERVHGLPVRLMVSIRHPETYAQLAAEKTRGGIHLTGDDPKDERAAKKPSQQQGYGAQADAFWLKDWRQ